MNKVQKIKPDKKTGKKNKNHNDSHKKKYSNPFWMILIFFIIAIGFMGLVYYFNLNILFYFIIAGVLFILIRVTLIYYGLKNKVEMLKK
jgi:Flp pilus assembly protein TadB